MRYILDTNIVSALFVDGSRVIEKLATVTRRDVAVPQPVFAEIAYGLVRLPQSKRKHALLLRFELLRSTLAIAPWTDAVTNEFGAIKAELERAGQRIEDFDAAIAAHARAHRSVLVTANTKHMQRVAGIELENWQSN